MFQVSFEFEQLKIEKYVLSVIYPYDRVSRCFKEFPFEYSVLKLDFSTLWIKSLQSILCYTLSLSWTIIIGKYWNYRLIEILIQYLNFFFFPYLELLRNFLLSLSLSILLNGNMFFHISFRRFNILMHTLISNESFLYPNNLLSNRETCKQVNVTSSQGNYISIFVSKTSPFPKQNWFRDLQP